MSHVPVSTMEDAELSRALAALSLTLDLSEARRVVELLGRDPTETELTLFDTMWSEHCSYKSSRAVLKKYLPTAAGNVILGPGEDAGIVRFAEIEGVKWAIAVAHESHNHPSQVMPVEGAATGIGGIVRDVYCMGADVIATLDPLRFGNPNGRHGERSLEIAREVMEGIALYGNALGVPNLGGDVVFDDCYDDNCLVNVVAVGLVREDHIVRSRVPDRAREEEYDFILVGKPTDWSGMGGAAFASADLDHAAALENRGSVQVPDPFLKRVLVLANRAVLELAREKRAPVGFKDLGAGGIACVSSEMADAGGFGIELDLALAHLAEDDLPDRVAACSETQERFGWAVPRRITEDVLAIYNETYDLPSMYEGACAVRVGGILVPDAGEVPRYRLRRGDEVLVDAPVSTITEGIAYERESRSAARPLSGELRWDDVDVQALWPQLLATEHLCSRQDLYQHYDGEVKANTVLRPGEADAGVVAPVAGSCVGLALSVDGNPRVSRVDPYLGGALAVVEGARNVACVGALPWAVTDCLNYGSPENPEVFHDFVAGVRGIGDACRGLGRLDVPEEPLPVVSGNVSFYNQSSTGRAIAPSPIICMLGLVADVSRVRSLSLKGAGNLIYRVGPFAPELGGSLLAHHLQPGWVGPVAAPDYSALRAEIRLVLQAMREGTAVAVHDISEGGMLAAITEMALGPEARGCRGARIDVTSAVAEMGDAPVLFGETGGFLVEVRADGVDAFENAARKHGAACRRLGAVAEEPRIAVGGIRSGKASWPLDELREAWQRTMPALLSRSEGPAAKDPGTDEGGPA